MATFGAVGDFGGTEERAGTVLDDIAERDLDAFFLLGDVSYGEIEPETLWCDWVHDHLGASFPFEVVAGNHEEDSKADGYIRDFAACMPDRLGSAVGPGGYGVNFTSDLGPVTVISTSPNLEVDGVAYDYDEGSPELAWMLAQIEAAQAEDDWVVVGMHKNCITIGNKSCEIGEAFAQRLIDAEVDLVLQGHDHDYQRSHALGSIVEDGVGSIRDSGSDGAYARGAGTVFVIAGIGGTYMPDCSHDDPEYGNFARHWCREEANLTIGYLVVTASAARLDAEFVATTGAAFSDAFVIQ
ncbi:MAG TPA: metallophosphoesterase [Kofleriaceae bacterium]|nr:metallophosphoesterase [Kofleriaceae bacterium]